MTDKHVTFADEKGPNHQAPDDYCNPMTVWCWPDDLRPFVGPCKYTRENINKIPTGSLYFASRRGEMSSINAQVTNSPYDVIGIVIQSDNTEYGTYVYTIETYYDPDTTEPIRKVKTVPMVKFIEDPRVYHHGVLPLKAFANDNDDYCTEPTPFPHKSYQNIGPSYGFDAVKAWADNFDQGRRKANKEKGGKKYSHWNVKDSSSSDSPTSSTFEIPADRTPNLEKKRVEVLKSLLQKYWNSNATYDSYQTLAAIFGLPVAEELRDPNQFTSPELIGLILYQAGLIWDNRFATGNKNPACCFNYEFFKKLADKAKSKSPFDAIVMLCSPNTHAQIRSRKPVVYDSSEQTSYPSFNDDSSSQEPSESTFPETISSHDNHKSSSSSSEEVVQKTNSLRQYLRSAYDQGYNCRVHGYRPDKGGEQQGEPVINILGDKGGYERGYAKANQFRGESLQQPCQVEVHALTIMFGSLRVSDFLRDYYAGAGIDINGYGNLIDGKYNKIANQSDLGSLVVSLANERAINEHLGYSLNELNLSSYHDVLIPIELTPDDSLNAVSAQQQELELQALNKLASDIKKDFLQKKMLNQDIGGLSGALLKNICERYTNLSRDLHELAKECKLRVRYSGKESSLDSFENSEDNSCLRFNVKLTSKHPATNEFAFVSWPYMWGLDWEYYSAHHLKCRDSRYWELECIISKIITNLEDLKKRTPKNCIILELIVCLTHQAKFFRDWINTSRDHYSRKVYRRRKGDEIETTDTTDL